MRLPNGERLHLGGRLGLATFIVACSSGAVGSPGPNLGSASTLGSGPESSGSGDDNDEEAGGSTAAPDESSGEPPPPGCMNGVVESGEFCFFELLYTDGIPGASWIASGSFDGDADADLAVAAQMQGAVYMLFGDGGGNFLFDQYYDVGPGVAVVAAGAFDDWTLPDLITTNGGDDTLSILLNTGTGQFMGAASLPVYADPLLIAIEDFNADGLSDLAVAHDDDMGQLSIILGSGTGLVAAGVLTVDGGDPLGLDAADVDGDAIVDLVVGIENVDEVAILKGDGAGAFIQSARFPSGGENAVAVEVTDLDGDGTPEIVVGNRFPEEADAGNMQIVDYDGAGWVSKQLFLSEGAGAIDMGDFDADGDVDIVLSTLEGGSVQIFLNTSGTFALGESFELEAPAEPFGVIAEDFDHDGISDVATADRLGSRIAILMAVP